MTEFKIVPHSVIPDRQVVEVWHNGQFIATITADDDNPGIRVQSKYQLSAFCGSPAPGVETVSVRVRP